MRGLHRVGLRAGQQVLELARRVVGVEDRNTAPQTGFRVLDLQQLQAQRVEGADRRSEEHTSELQSLMRNSYSVFCMKEKNSIRHNLRTKTTTPQSKNKK